VPVAGLVNIFFELERAHVHNINLVSPAPYLPQIASAISAARSKGIGIPFVYNTNAYESADALRSLLGLVDIYLPDFKYWSDKAGNRLSSCSGYRDAAMAAILEMKSQVGDLDSGARPAKRGLLVRHLVLPGMVAATEQIVRWVRDHLGRDTFVSLMAQYHPVHRAHELPLLRRGIRHEEYERAMQACTKAGLDNVFVQELESASLFLPDFEREKPFNSKDSNECQAMSNE
jgi:putative pyruvate formate lyase activating enzyme